MSVYAGNQPLNRHERRAYVSALKRDNKAFPNHLIQIDFSGQHADAGVIEAWRSRNFCVQIYDKPNSNAIRMSVSRTDIKGDRWVSGITWDDLQRLKRECGRGMNEGFEIYPKDDDIVNVANMRHIWIFKDESKLPFGFGRESSEDPKKFLSHSEIHRTI